MAKPAIAATQQKAARTGRKTRARKNRTIKNKEEQPNQPQLSRSQIAYQGFDETGSAFLGAHRTQGKTLETTSLMDVAIWARTTGYASGIERNSRTAQRRTKARNVRGDKGEQKANIGQAAA